MMPSMTQRQKPSEEDWQRHKSEIWRLYIKEQCALHKLISFMAQHGFTVTKAQMEFRLKKWRFRQKISNKAWRYIDHQLTKRELAGKKSLVQVSGLQLDPEKVHRERIRNRPLDSWRHQNSPTPELADDMSLKVCTPVSTALPLFWPQNLPWIQFLDAYGHIFSSLQMQRSVPQSGVPQIISLIATQGPGLWLGRPMLAHQLSHLEAEISRFMPEMQFGESLARSKIVLSGSFGEKLQEAAKLLVIRASNNLLTFQEILEWAPVLEFLFRGSRPLQKTINKPSVFQDRTFLAFADTIFRLCLQATMHPSMDLHANPYFRAADPQRSGIAILTWLLEFGYDVNRPFCSSVWGHEMQSALQFCVLQMSLKIPPPADGSLELIHVLIRYDADPYKVTTTDSRCPLVKALESDRMPTIVQEILIDQALAKPMPNSWQWHRLLVWALEHGKEALLLQLLNEGEPLEFRIPNDHDVVTHDDALTHAVRFPEDVNGIQPPEYSPWLDFVWGQLLARNQRPSQFEMPIDFTNALISAAGVGNIRAVLHLVALGGNPAASNDAEITPLFSAALAGQLSTCELLLRSFQVDINAAGPGGLRAIHMACWSSRPDVLGFMINAGADVNATVDAKKDNKAVMKAFKKCPPQVHLLLDQELSPLDIALWRFLALREGRDRILSLLEAGATLRGHEFSAIAAQGDCGLARSLVEAGVDVTANVDLSLAPNWAVDLITSPRYSYVVHTSLEKLGVAIRDRPELSMLQVACCHGNVEMALFLLEHGAALNGCEIWMSLLTEAYVTDRHLLCEQLRLAGADFANPPSYEVTFLELAFRLDDKELVEWALTSRPQHYDPGSLCAAAFAADDGSAEVWATFATEMLRRRPETFVVDMLETTAVAIAVESGNIDLLQQLLDVLPVDNVCFIGNFGLEKLDWDLKPAYWRDEHRVSGSPLAVAVHEGNETASTLLLDKGYKPDICSLMAAVEKNDLASAEKLLTLCCQCQIEVKQTLMDKAGWAGWTTWQTPIQLAARTASAEMIRLLLRSGWDANDWVMRGRFRRSPLQSAVERGDIDLVRILLEAGAHVNERPAPQAGATALQLAAIKGHINIAKMLLEYKEPAKVNAHRAIYHGRTALEGAAEHGRIDMLQLLLSSGAKTEGSGQRQYIRAIQLAAEEGQHVAEEILRAHRSWTEDDEECWRTDLFDFDETWVSDSECTDSECSEPHDGDDEDDDVKGKYLGAEFVHCVTSEDENESSEEEGEEYIGTSGHCEDQDHVMPDLNVNMDNADVNPLAQDDNEPMNPGVHIAEDVFVGYSGEGCMDWDALDSENWWNA